MKETKRWNKQKTANIIIVGFTPTTLITFIINNLNTPIKTQILSHLMKKQNSTTYFLRSALNKKSQVESKRMNKLQHANTNQKKLKGNINELQKGKNYKMIKASVLKGDITILSVNLMTELQNM